MKLRFKVWGLVLALFPFALSAQTPEATEPAEEAYLSEEELYNEALADPVGVSDPFESVNRVTFQINDFFYLKVLRPVAAGYRMVTPDPVERGAVHFFQNLKYPVRLVGNLLQARWKGAWVETGRFAVNTTVGIAGIMRPADSIQGLEPIPSEDIGQAMGAWGIGEGPFLILPLLGPSNLRDFGGYIGDRAVNPLQEPFSMIDHWSWDSRLWLSGTEVITMSPLIVKRYMELKDQAIDPYSSLKNGYTQLRRAAVKE